MTLVAVQQFLLFRQIYKLHPAALEAQGGEICFGDLEKNIDKRIAQSAHFEFFHVCQVSPY